MANFTGTLNTNEFYNSLFNAYRLITTFADGLEGLDKSLATRFKADGGRYRDKSVYTDTDILKSREWDPTDTNVLATEQKVNPKQQEIVVKEKRQIGLTTDTYLTSRAWYDENAFQSFNSVVQAQVGNTKDVYEQRMVNTAVGTMETSIGKQSVTVEIPALDGSETFAELEAFERLRARKIGKQIAQIFRDVKDTTRDFNDYGFMKAYNKDSMLVIWNGKYIDQFQYVDLPTIFHKDGIIEFTGEQLPGRYFGNVASSSDVGQGKILEGNTYHSAVGELRSLVEKDYIVSGVSYHVFPGDLIQDGATVGGSSAAFKYAETYKVNDKIICKIVHKDGIKYLSSFETSTDFFNSKNLSTNRYLTWMYAKPDYLRNYPLITLTEVAPQ